MAILIIMYLLGGILLTYLDFYYLGLTYIIIYVGAIAIIFLFIIMMIEVQNTVKQQSFFLYYLLIFILSLGYF